MQGAGPCVDVVPEVAERIGRLLQSYAVAGLRNSVRTEDISGDAIECAVVSKYLGSDSTGSESSVYLILPAGRFAAEFRRHE